MSDIDEETSLAELLRRGGDGTNKAHGKSKSKQALKEFDRSDPSRTMYNLAMSMATPSEFTLGS
jgi:hypothetical protein